MYHLLNSFDTQSTKCVILWNSAIGLDRGCNVRNDRYVCVVVWEVMQHFARHFPLHTICDGVATDISTVAPRICITLPYALKCDIWSDRCINFPRPKAAFAPHGVYLVCTCNHLRTLDDACRLFFTCISCVLLPPTHTHSCLAMQSVCTHDWDLVEM